MGTQPLERTELGGITVINVSRGSCGFNNLINTLPDREHGDDLVKQIQEDGLQRHHVGAEAVAMLQQVEIAPNASSTLNSSQTAQPSL